MIAASNKAGEAEPAAVIIARDGEPLVKVVAFEAPAKTPIRRLGVMSDDMMVRDGFGRMGEADIQRVFEGNR
jgi:hypothetical protein